MAGPDGEKEYQYQQTTLLNQNLLKVTFLNLLSPTTEVLFTNKSAQSTALRLLVRLFNTMARITLEGKWPRISYFACVTYFRINVGDQVTIIIPTDNPDATWAAVEAAL